MPQLYQNSGLPGRPVFWEILLNPVGSNQLPYLLQIADLHALIVVYAAFNAVSYKAAVRNLLDIPVCL
jgi:hypothetical protein